MPEDSIRPGWDRKNDRDVVLRPRVRAIRAIRHQDPDFAELTEIANAAVPFGVFTGAQVTALDADQALAGVPDNPDLRSHVNTVHAVALHLAADIACAVAFVGAATPGLGEVEWMVVRDSHSAFFKPAVGRIRAICDDNDVLVGKVSFQYVTKLAASQSAAV